MKKLFISLFCFLLLASISSRAAIRYVNINVVGGTGTGLSWANAYSSLQSAIDAASSGDQIWVAKGTYYPSKDPSGNASPADSRDKTFYLKNGVAIYGGFAGGEAATTDRVTTNITILSGDIGTVNTIGDNCYHVVLSVSDANTTKLDGLTITAGYANGSNSITVETKSISPNSGGGLYNESTSLSLTNITFSVNKSSYVGGGIYNSSSSPSLINVVFSGNNTTNYGGGIYNISSSPTITSCLFLSNLGGSGGGIFIDASSAPTITNVTFYANVALTLNGTGTGGAITNNATATIKNCIFWGNKAAFSTTDPKADISSSSAMTISYSDLQLANNTTNYPAAYFSTIGSSNNIFAQDPKFLNINNLTGSDGVLMTADDGLELKGISPCINIGTSTGASAADITGFARVNSPEMGAYEYNPATCPSFTNNIAYVNAAAAGSNNGTTWTNAYTSLESALAAARNCGVTQIWVAKGTYKPSADPFGYTSPTDPRDKTFYLENGVSMYGGFAGNESLITQRVAGNVTILSGDIGTVNDASDNSYHVVLSVSDANTTKLDGFTITGGNANGNSSMTVENLISYQSSGGGMYNNASSPTITNVIFSANSTTSTGGGMYNDNASAPSLTNVAFLSNISTNSGGGLYNSSSSPTLMNVVFFANSATLKGGGMYNTGASPTLTNVVFSGNSANNFGGGLYNTGSSPILINVTFSRNACPNVGGGVFNDFSSAPTLKNGIFWENTKAGDATAYGADAYSSSSTFTVSYTSMQLANNTTNYPTAGFPSIGSSNNIFAQDPKFIDADTPAGADAIFMTVDDGLSIKSISPCMDFGTATGAPTTDITGYTRVGNPDMGAYEYNTYNACPTYTNNIAYVNGGVVGGTNKGTSWANSFKNLESALIAARECGVTQIWVAKGTYFPTKDPFGSGLPADPRDKTFYLVNNVAIYGGFAGTETLITQRVTGNATILSGDIGTVGSITDNCYHVLLSVSDVNTTKLDGFTITGGNSSGSSTMVVETQGIYRDSGGGMYNDHSSPSFTNVVFSANSSSYSGGAIYNATSSPSFTNVVFSANSTSYVGGGMYNSSSSPNLTNVTFSANVASSFGGGMANSGSSAVIIKNGIFWGNTKVGDATLSGADVENNGANPTLTASYTAMQLVYNTTNYSTANFPNISTSNNIFAQNPNFFDATDADGLDNIFMNIDDGLKLLSTSPCINAGTATGAPTTDITGTARLGNTDMGAYEYGSICLSTLTPTGSTTTNQKAATTVISITGNSTNGTQNIIPNSAIVTYQGGKYIQLNPGFVANKTSVFTAKVLAGCQ